MLMKKLLMTICLGLQPSPTGLEYSNTFTQGSVLKTGKLRSESIIWQLCRLCRRGVMSVHNLFCRGLWSFYLLLLIIRGLVYPYDEDLSVAKNDLGVQM